ncbi:hypothetical protein IQ241_00435 [Romeria aff. gracilis LEGE 07310]|uniref:Uncharacterized protein n=1 Tax=Vasconcelosia minhoensis LEGE 07310 TaxID=915328 RepID=A0A8J7AHZ6_9CYAN|nr:hypothetical protein [Romeria gracilis]MBE9075780.1 hypothetical protein [Romeria aff. gracilis LEGE 07310]
MWEDPVLEELYRIREEHAKAFNYDFKAIFADWKKRQSESARKIVSLQTKGWSATTQQIKQETPPGQPANG